VIELDLTYTWWCSWLHHRRLFRHFITVLRHIFNLGLTQQRFFAAVKEAAIVPVYMETIMLTWAITYPFLFSTIYLNFLNSLFIMFRITPNVIPINTVSPELTLQTPILVTFLDFLSHVVCGQCQADAVYFIYMMLLTLSFRICSCINWVPSDSLMLMLAGFAVT
jgi:hypothetical protein